MATPQLQDAPGVEPSAISGSAVRAGDKQFRALSQGAGITVLVIMAAIGAFLIWKAIPSLTTNTANFFTELNWFPDQEPPVFGIAAIAFGTIVAAVIAMLIAVPIAFGIALFIAFYAPKRLGAALAFIIDLLAAVPSIVFGLWGLQVLLPNMEGLQIWMNDYLGWIPFFNNTTGVYGRSLFLAGVVLSIMVLPTISAITREVFVQVPRAHIEAALALGATRWEMVRMAVFPFGRPGMISATMLGLGRALGETIAVALVIASLFTINWHITEPGGITFASLIALRFNEAGPNGVSALIAAGLVLFVITLAVNMLARWIIARRAEFSGAN